MKPILKILIGALLVITGIFSSLTFSAQLINLIQAVIGPLLIIVGAFLTWLESDEFKNSRKKESKSGFDVQQSLKQSAAEKTEKEPEPQEPEQDKIKCPDCGKEFDTERGMKIHRTQKHGQ